MSDHDPALIEKAAKTLADAEPDTCFDCLHCDMSDPDVCSCWEDRDYYRARARAVLDAVADDLRAAAWDEGHRGGELDGSYRLAVHAGFRAPAPGHLNPYRKEADRG